MSKLIDQRARAQRLIDQAVAMLQREGASREAATYLVVRSAALARSEVAGMGGAVATLTELAAEYAKGAVE